MSSRLWVAALLACCAAAGLVLAACGGEEPAPIVEVEPQAAAQPQPAAASPPATETAEQPQAAAPVRSGADPVGLLIVESAALERNGYWEQALNVRESALRSADSLPPEQLASLRLDQARLLLKLGRPQDAQAILEVVRERADALSAAAERRRLLLTAQTALRLGETEAAVAAMSSYVNSDSPAWAVVALELARTLQAAGQGEAAVEWAERALGGSLPFADQLRAIYLAATELDNAGESARALAYYEALLEQSPWRSDQAAALSRIGALQAELGDADAAAAAWRRLVQDYRGFSERSAALTSLLNAGMDVDQLSIGLVRFDEERWGEARAAMLNVLGGSDALAEQVAGEFYIAAIHHANDDVASAVLGYEAVIGRDASDPLAAAAMMRLADVAVADGDLPQAEVYWRRVMTEHPQHERAAEAARRWAMRPVALGEWGQAGLRFRDAANSGADHWGELVRLEFLYWSALMYAEAGDTETAQDLALKVIESGAGGYFGLRAALFLGLEAPSVLTISTAEWLTRLTGEADPPELNLGAAAEWRAAQELRQGGFDDAADRVIGHWIETLAADPWALAAAAALLAAQDEPSGASRAASRVLDVFELDWMEAPAELLRLAYPQPWPDVMALHAAAEGIDPLLLWALIRRESFYDPDASGAAGEVGLTQVIPLTGADIAAGLGLEYAHDDLARPELAIQFGAWYLARQLEGFAGEPLIALAAYNAGPGNAARWESEALLPGPDAFLAAMDFPSTRAYVRYVLETLAVYQALARAAE